MITGNLENELLSQLFCSKGLPALEPLGIVHAHRGKHSKSEQPIACAEDHVHSNYCYHTLAIA